MSKTKTKRARRELKREGQKKLQRSAKAASKAHPPASKPPTTTKPKSKPSNPAPAPTSTPSQPVQKHTHPNPFTTYANILLVGEGDFSFTRSLALTHGCAHLVASSYDSESTLLSKYPSFAPIRSTLTSLTPPVPLYHSIDATKLHTYKHLRPADDDTSASFDVICFMFPHTGGLSTDVNRQVRANQALLVGFFESCLKDTKRGPMLDAGGKVVVALFEGEPYTLWNVRDLARHAGLRVVESWGFEWGDYPGYKHVRTLGVVEGGGGWRGEERRARMFLFEKV
ncbi:hypothetical protein M011DRAFT_385233, partial [Sporormia fimetaria CBS 119925]